MHIESTERHTKEEEPLEICMQLSCEFENHGGIRNKKTRSENYAAILLKIRIWKFEFFRIKRAFEAAILE